MLPLNEPVHRSTLEAEYGKSNYARRIRKIISEYGWQIDTERGRNGANDDWYTRRSDGPVRPQAIRREVPKAKRFEVYERDSWICQLCGCGVSLSQRETMPQCDHKVPAERGGSPNQTNLQTLCTQCNLKKRQSCRTCTLPTCNRCPLACPEQYDQVVVVTLAKDATESLKRDAIETGRPIPIIISEIVARHYDSDGDTERL
jgi:5-methylcytosine-specific restriction enzyme A